MKLLLTSGGVTNATIRGALERMLGGPIADSHALLIPTAQWGHPACSPRSVRRTTAAAEPGDALAGLGWASIGVLELTALPTIGAERWVPWVREADVLLVDGGDATYLAHWMRESGLLGILPSLPDTVWVGVSAGSMVMTPRIGPEFVAWDQSPGDETLGLVDFSLFPHLDHPGWSSNTREAARRWATGIAHTAYAIDDASAVSVVDGVVEVVSEGRWELLNG